MTSTRRLKDKEVKALLRDLVETYPVTADLRSAKNFDELTVGDRVAYFIDGAPLLIRTKVGLMPSLKFGQMVNSFPRVVVDMGAVAHIANGANIMRPGVRRIEGDFGKEKLVVVVDEKYGKPLALGLTKVDSAEMKLMTRGEVIENIHYVGDDLWNSFTKSS